MALAASGAWFVCGDAVVAQAAAEPAQAGEIVVKGLRPDVIKKLDRKIYSVDSDLEGASGTAVEILNKLPSVAVDTDGQVSLRGDGNVTILIDGRPSNQASGADALSQIQGKDIDKVEIITNPPAEFKADGVGGIINIVTKKNRTPGVSGNAQANAGNKDRYLLGLSGAYKKGGLNLSGGVTLKQDVRIREGVQERRILDPASNAFVVNNQTTREDSTRVTPSVKSAADYTFENGETIGLSYSYAERRGERDSVQFNEVRDASGALERASRRAGDGSEWRLDTAAGARYERKLFSEEDLLKFNLQQTALREREVFDYVTRFDTPSQPSEGDRVGQNTDFVKTEFSADYELPFKSGATLKAGYNLEHDSNAYDYSGGVIDLTTGAVTNDQALDNRFHYNRKIQALYGSYETKLGPIDVQTGLRIEQTDIATRLLNGGFESRRDDVRLYPSLYLSRELDDSRTLSVSYSRRISRPDPEALNPFIDRRDPRNLRSGNPDLKPKDTHSFELGYEFDADGFGYNITGFYRRNRNSITNVTQVISDDVVLVTRGNLNKDNAGGLELGMNGKLSSKFSYKLSGDIFYREIDATAFGGEGAKSDIAGNGKASLDYKPTRTDTLQISANYTGERLTPQGSVSAFTTVNVGYKRLFSDALSGLITVSDLFNDQKFKRRFDTPDLQDVSDRRQAGPVVFIGLVYTFGGKAKTKDNFNYDDAGGAGG
ncbi:MAG: TonB-dependent receptor [Caulobacterales bacterium]